jgi:hypothetical protein
VSRPPLPPGAPPLSPSAPAVGSPALLHLARTQLQALPVRPVVRHPAEDELTRANQAWAIAHGLVVGGTASARHAAIRTGSFAAHTYPRAPRAVAQLGADLISWLFLFDDQVGERPDGASTDELRARLDTYDRALRAGTAPPGGTAFHRALIDIGARGAALGGERWLARFADAMASYYEGCVQEVPYRAGGHTPTLDGYRDLRALTVGAYPVFTLIEPAASVSLDDAEATSPPFTALVRLAALLCAWVNDLYSFAKERDAQDRLNLVAVLETERGLPWSGAIDAAIAVFCADLSFFQTESLRLRASASPAALAYLGGLEDWVHGNRAWTELCGRYV